MALALLLPAACRKGPEGPLVPPPETYRGWTRWPEEPLDYPIPGHLANARIVYRNKLAQESRSETRGGRVFDVYPKGAVIVKEIYPSLEADLPPRQLTVMIKNPDHPHGPRRVGVGGEEPGNGRRANHRLRVLLRLPLGRQRTAPLR